MPTPAPRAQVSPGQPLQIHAATWNALLSMLAKFQAGQLGSPPSSSAAGGPPGLDVRVLNDSGYDVPRGGVLGIDGVEVNRSYNADEFETRPTLTGVTPAARHFGKFVVALEPIADGDVGRAVLSGLAAVKLYVADVYHRFADVKVGDRDELVTVASGGSARIVYQQSGAGTGIWALVVLGQRQSLAPLNCKIFNANDTWTVPAGVNQVMALAVGGGGGGGRGGDDSTTSSTDNQGHWTNWKLTGGSGGGGGGGGGCLALLPVEPGDELVVTVGVGGSGTYPASTGGGSMITIDGINRAVAAGGYFGGDASGARPGTGGAGQDGHGDFIYLGAWHLNLMGGSGAAGVPGQQVSAGSWPGPYGGAGGMPSICVGPTGTGARCGAGGSGGAGSGVGEPIHAGADGTPGLVVIWW